MPRVERKLDEFTLVATKVEQWETECLIKELGIYGKDIYGLVIELSREVKRLRDLFDASEEPYNELS